MKKYVLSLLFLFNVSAVYAADLADDCEPAVDAANRLNSNDDKHCDYSNTGLNGVLHRAFAKKSDESQEALSDERKAGSDEKTADVKDHAKSNAAKSEVTTSEGTTAEATTKASFTSSEFTSAQQLQTLRYALIQKAIQECTKGFIVEGERYFPTGSKATKLELIYHCL